MHASDDERRNLPQIKPRVLLLGAACLLLSSTIAQASDAERGRAIAEQWCSVCHAETASETDQDMEAPFEELVARPGRDGARLRALMDEDHFPMTTFRLFADEKDDVVAYLVGLRHQQLAPLTIDILVDNGRALLEPNCGECHAIGMDEESPLQAAPAFGDIALAYDPEFLAEPLAEGIVTGHPDMPEFVFQPDEIDAIIAYLSFLRHR
ncbi:MAG: c-type cytochrome [Hyphomicrobiales bacterium]